MARGVMKGLAKNRRSLVMFLIGLMIGSSLFLFFYGQKIDSLLSERNAIYYANNQKYKEILKLQEEIAQLTRKGERHRESEDLIQKIIVEVNSNQPYITDAVKTQVEEKLSPFLNKSMQWISNNPDIIELVLEKQQIVINDGQNTKVEIHLKYISFYKSTLKIWVETMDSSHQLPNSPT
jgi:ribosome-associated translation inhibitor RaiA